MRHKFRYNLANLNRIDRILMKTRAFSHWLLAVVASFALLLQGCGFHLRGQFELPSEVLNLYINEGERDFVKELEKVLEFSGVLLADSPGNVAVLDLSEMEYEREVHSTDAAGRAKEYKLKYTIPYTLETADGEELKEDQISGSRTLKADPAKILQIEKEEEFKREEMEKELATRLVRQISRIDKKSSFF